MKQSLSFKDLKNKSAAKVFIQAEKFGCLQLHQNPFELAFSNSMKIDWFKKAVISEN